MDGKITAGHSLLGRQYGESFSAFITKNSFRS
jgi:hypothetical protein